MHLRSHAGCVAVSLWRINGRGYATLNACPEDTIPPCYVDAQLVADCDGQSNGYIDAGGDGSGRSV